MKRAIVATLFVAGCAAGAADEAAPVAQRWPVDDLGTPTGLVIAAAILRGSVPTIRVLHRREPQP